MVRGDLAGQDPSVAVPPPVTAAWVEEASAGVGPLEVSGQGLLQMVFAAGREMIASELEGSLAEGSPDQKKVSGQEGLPDLVVLAELQVLG